MSHLRPLDRALVLILVPLFAVCFALSVKTQIEGGGIAALGFSVANRDSYPVLTGEASLLHPSDPLAPAGLAAGDALIRVGASDLRGVGFLGFTGLAREASGGDLAVPLVYERDRQLRETSLPLAPVSIFRSRLVAGLVIAAAALFLLLRATPSPMVRALFQVGLAVGFSQCIFFGSAFLAYAWGFTFVVGTCMSVPLAFRLFLLFPDDVAPTGRWHRIWPWFFVAPGVFAAAMLSGRIAFGEAGMLATTALGVAAVLAVGTFKYRSGDALTRRQFKWVMFGLYCALVPFLAAAALVAVAPEFGWVVFAAVWIFPILPISALVAVARYNLFDVDRLLSATATYNILAVLLVGTGLVVVPRAALAASSLVGIDPQTGQIALSLLLAGLAVPAQRRLRPQVDRIFFKERYAVDHGIAEMLSTLSACADARELTEHVGTGLVKLLRPEACVVYAFIDGSYVPVFVEGRAVPPAFEADNLLIEALRRSRSALALSDAGRRPDRAPLGPFDRAALETLQTEVVVPVRQGDGLPAFLCLGPKRSGDVYTSTDLSLLAAVAEKVSSELRGFDQDETIREAREMQASLRRYVPGAVAEQLASGSELVSGEREVSVLFVDIRGYTGFSESRGAEEIFSTVNRYTETVSQIVQAHAGCVVEFNGDGMMAVFGAPMALPEKERAAVRAAREIVAEVGTLEFDGVRLQVGVGIATGDAYVGNIQASDRLIWSAIGNTTNLAARLQALSRDLDAAVVIDATTWTALEPGKRSGFVSHAQTLVRGRSASVDVFALPVK